MGKKLEVLEFIKNTPNWREELEIGLQDKIFRMVLKSNSYYYSNCNIINTRGNIL